MIVVCTSDRDILSSIFYSSICSVLVWIRGADEKVIHALCNREIQKI